LSHAAWKPIGHYGVTGDLSAGWRRRQDLEHPPVRDGPDDHGHNLASRAAHTDRPLGKRRAIGTARAHAVARPPTRRRRDGVSESRHDRPEAGTNGEDLHERPRHAERLPINFEDDLEPSQLHDATPSAPSERAIRS